VTTGIGYRLNAFLSKTSINFFSFSLGGGVTFIKLRDSVKLLRYNSLVEFDLTINYGLRLGKYRQHQLSLFGFSFLLEIYGLLERNIILQKKLQKNLILRFGI